VNPSYRLPSTIVSRKGDTVAFYIIHEAKAADCLGVVFIITDAFSAKKTAYVNFNAFLDKSETSHFKPGADACKVIC
jgi:hypothetical protein